MAMWLQHLLTLTLAAGCLAVVLWQGVKTLRTGKGIGSCCAKGCSPARTAESTTVFISSDNVRIQRRRSVQ